MGWSVDEVTPDFVGSGGRAFAACCRIICAQRRDGCQQSLPIAERADTELLEIIVRQLTQQLRIDLVLGE